MITASFNNINLENIEGYRISCSLAPGQGFDGSFYVYLEERRQAQTPFNEGVDTSKAQDGSIKPVRGTLSVQDEDRSYQFKDIDLYYVELGATRRERTRYFEFKYDQSITDSKGAAPITINGKKKEQLGASGLGKDYMGGCDQNCNLLGFRAFVSANTGTIVRFSNLGCMEKSFLAKVIELNKSMQAGDKILPDFTVTFSQGDFAVTRNNLVRFGVEESYGSLMNEDTPGLYRYLEGRGSNLERLRPSEHQASHLLRHDLERDFKAEGVEPGTVETATLLFKQGYYHTLSVR